MKWIILIIIIWLILAALFFRYNPIPSSKVHKDPEEIGVANNEGGFFVHPTKGDIESPAYKKSADEIKTALTEMMLAMGGKQIDSNSDDFITFEFRSKAFGFPDFLSVKVITDKKGKSRPVMYSRLFYGRKDFDVNQKRVEAILSTLN